MTQDSDRSLEIVVLLIFGTFMLIFGVLLFKIQDGSLPYNSNGAYGLSLVLQAFLVIAMGRTPFGDFRRSWVLVIAGICVAVFGMSVCLLPGFFPDVPRVLTGVILLAGGVTLLLQLLISEKKAWLWTSIGGVLLNLTIACALVYALTAFVGLMTLAPDVQSLRPTAIILLFYAASLFYLAVSLRLIPTADSPQAARLVPDTAQTERSGLFGEASLPLSQACLVLTATLLTLFGLLLVLFILLASSGVGERAGFSPASLSSEGELGLMLVVMAIQAMCLGSTPLGDFKLSPIITIVGLAFAAMGIVASITPGLLTGVITILIGVLNIIQGGTSLIKRFLPGPQETEAPSAAPVAVPPEFQKLMATQTVISCLALAFGASMLFPGVIPGFLMPVVLVLFGLLMFRLVLLLRKLAALQPALA
jgi:hypothetical protein